MIISRTPLRISFFGGGTDYPDHYESHGGEVLSTSINQYVYLTINRLSPFFDHRIHIGYSRSERVVNVDEIEHPSVRWCLKHLQVDNGVEIFVMSDLPARTGLGSSSAFTVGLLHCLHAFKNNLVTKDFLAREAIYVEQKLIQERVGSQDQVIAAYGGLNHIHFERERTFWIDPLPVMQSRQKLLESHLMLFFTSIARSANEILEEQCAKIKVNTVPLQKIQEQVGEGVQILCNPDRNIHEFGELLHEAWLLKRSLSSRVSTAYIDEAYDTARARGAIGGKLLGAGGGGFLLLFAPPEKHEEIRQNLPKLMHVPFAFENEGTRLIYFSG
jgi:D-glycero-alpha-D-manno-heptose-7-phosphate kinase